MSRIPDYVNSLDEIAGPSMWDYDEVQMTCTECERKFNVATSDPKVLSKEPICFKCEAEARKEKWLCSQCNQTFWCDPGEVGEFGILCDGEEPICDECWEAINKVRPSPWAPNTTCTRPNATRCNFVHPNVCCGGGADGPCECDCHKVTP